MALLKGQHDEWSIKGLYKYKYWEHLVSSYTEELEKCPDQLLYVKPLASGRQI